MTGAAIIMSIAGNIRGRMIKLILREVQAVAMGFGVNMRRVVAEHGGGGASRLNEILRYMRRIAGKPDRRAVIESMKRFGIHAKNPIGLTTPQLRAIARNTGRDQQLAEALWETGIHDAMILASLVSEPSVITRAVMERWVRDFASWGVCDACCCNVFDRSPHAWAQIRKWVRRRGEFARRAGFATIAAIAVHDKKADDRVFLDALPLIEAAASDDRNFVKKSVNWALRNIGKRNPTLRLAAIACAERVRAQGTPPARWIAADALRELRARG
jgi:3-methyladenine DNA glycosylase AlkD